MSLSLTQRAANLQKKPVSPLTELEQLHTRLDNQSAIRVDGLSVYVTLHCSHPEFHLPRAGDDAARAVWHSLDNLPSLAFDHTTIVDVALSRIVRDRIQYSDAAFRLLAGRVHSCLNFRQFMKSCCRRELRQAKLQTKSFASGYRRTKRGTSVVGKVGLLACTTL